MSKASVFAVLDASQQYAVARFFGIGVDVLARALRSVADASRLATQGDAFLALLVTASLQPEEPITCVRSLYVCNQTLGAFTAIILGPGHAFNRHRLGDMFEACLYVTGHPAVASDAPHPWASTWDDAGLERAWRCVLALKAWVTGKGTAAPIADPHAPGVVLTAQAVAPVVPDAHAASDAKRELAQGAQAVEQRLQQERALRLHASITAGDYSAALDLADADQRARTTAALAQESVIRASAAAAANAPAPAPAWAAPVDTERSLAWYRKVEPGPPVAHDRPAIDVKWTTRTGTIFVTPSYHPCCGVPAAAPGPFCRCESSAAPRHSGAVVSSATTGAVVAAWSCCGSPAVLADAAPWHFAVIPEWENGCVASATPFPPLAPASPPALDDTGSPVDATDAASGSTVLHSRAAIEQEQRRGIISKRVLRDTVALRIRRKLQSMQRRRLPPMPLAFIASRAPLPPNAARVRACVAAYFATPWTGDARELLAVEDGGLPTPPYDSRPHGRRRTRDLSLSSSEGRRG